MRWMMGICLAGWVWSCGGKAIVDDPLGGGGAGGSTSNGSTSGSTTAGPASGSGGSLPDECVVETDRPGPYPVTFRFTNSSMQTLFMRIDCELHYSLLACADGYAESLARSAACTADCTGPDDCILCGPCPFGSVPVGPGQSYEDGWSGNTFTFDTNASGCQCHDSHVAPAARYRIRVPVYGEESGRAEVSHEVEVDFELPASGGEVLVDLAP